MASPLPLRLAGVPLTPLSPMAAALAGIPATPSASYINAVAGTPATPGKARFCNDRLQTVFFRPRKLILCDVERITLRSLNVCDVHCRHELVGGVSARSRGAKGVQNLGKRSEGSPVENARAAK